jgi:pseudouridine kinase
MPPGDATHLRPAYIRPMTGGIVACIGGCHLDAKAVVDGPVVAGTSNPVRVTRTPGGVAGNVARWLARLGVPVELHSVVGADDAGRGLLATLGGEGVDVEGVLVADDAATAAYTAVIDGTGALALGIADMDVYRRLDEAWAEGVLARTAASVIVLDANPTAAAITALVDGKGGRWIAADPVSVDKARRMVGVLGGIDAIFPDGLEAAVLGGAATTHSAAIAIHGRGVGEVVVTLGPEGVFVADRDGVRARPAVPPSSVVDVTGAGDALVAGYVYAIVAAQDDPVGWGLAAASLAVETDSSIPPGVTVESVRARLP